jgi:cell division transport system permease protein
MDLRTALSRAKRGFRDDLRLHLIAIASLVVAFLCLEAALLSVANLARVADRWRGAQHLTVYLKDGQQQSEVGQLRLVLESLHEAQEVRHVTAEQARQEFAAQVEAGVDPNSLPADAFPASLEVVLRGGVSQQRAGEIAERVRSFGAVEDVETYRDWFAQMSTLLSAGRSAVALLALLVAVCVLAIIGNTIRLAVANRRREIEVLKLCGATDGYVRNPFVLEGAVQAIAAAIVALLLLLVAYLCLRGHIESTLSSVIGVKPAFLEPMVMAGVVLGGGLMGALGSALSLRRYLRV